ncbi:HNH endonuclease signature motif containing protein [Novosphingobium sp.]|uniref:HNH endonuclease signature motif containing protein n=1 Tax=Novosphingobium sp. TaxID=1874826 RepID=UPI00286E8A40|nr:HNH endonuclease signature motif containing protein [Novosphingobium sp.]
MADRSTITPELCRQLLRYEPETGRLFWLHRPRVMFNSDRIFNSWNSKWAGAEGFTSMRGSGADYKCYIGGIHDMKFKAHRVAWAIYYGEWPNEIDHINGNPLDNRIANLRSVSHRENSRNRRMPTNNKSGHMGVRWDAKFSKWLARIKVDKGYKHIGLFADINDAIAARKAAEIELGYHDNHGR